MLHVFNIRGAAFGNHVQASEAIAISTVNTVVSAGAGINLDVARTNISDVDIIVAVPADASQRDVGFDFQIDARDGSGNAVSRTQLGQSILAKGLVPHAPSAGLTNSGVLQVLKPNGKAHQSVAISDLYDLSHPGRYTIQVQQIDRVSGALVKSNRITLTVIP